MYTYIFNDWFVQHQDNIDVGYGNSSFIYRLFYSVWLFQEEARLQEHGHVKII